MLVNRRPSRAKAAAASEVPEETVQLGPTGRLLVNSRKKEEHVTALITAVSEKNREVSHRRLGASSRLRVRY